VSAPSGRRVLAIHGGAGQPPAGGDEARAAAERALGEALRAGWAILAAGGPALDAVEAAVASMEAGGCFNAGRGAVADRDGGVTLDATIMDGSTRATGAVAAVEKVTSAIAAARRVMEATPHVLLAGAGADAFALAAGVPPAAPDYFLRRPAVAATPGTVGAVALDGAGRLAAATAGGIAGKLPGRVGDSAVPGAGTWADGACAISATGTGEMFIRAAFAHQIAWRVGRGAEPLAEAARRALDEVRALGGAGGCVAVDAAGNVAMPFSTPVMYRGVIGDSDGAGDQPSPQIAMFPDS
jgi:beta-aspartyl-peptidase (threonine type)